VHQMGRKRKVGIELLQGGRNELGEGFMRDGLFMLLIPYTA
jgi:hypothetical protein